MDDSEIKHNLPPLTTNEVYVVKQNRIIYKNFQNKLDYLSRELTKTELDLRKKETVLMNSFGDLKLNTGVAFDPIQTHNNHHHESNNLSKLTPIQTPIILLSQSQSDRKKACQSARPVLKSSLKESNINHSRPGLNKRGITFVSSDEFRFIDQEKQKPNKRVASSARSSSASFNSPLSISSFSSSSSLLALSRNSPTLKFIQMTINNNNNNNKPASSSSDKGRKKKNKESKEQQNQSIRPPRELINALIKKDPIFARRYKCLCAAKLNDEAPKFDPDDNIQNTRISKSSLNKRKKEIINSNCRTKQQETHVYRLELEKQFDKARKFCEFDD